MGKKYSRNTYIIFALICLIVLNIGTIIIRTMGDRTKLASNDEVKPVFNYQKNSEKDENFFIALFGRTSSIINLYRIQEFPEYSWKDYLSANLSLPTRLNNLIKSQFSSIMKFNKDTKPVNKTELDEDDMEDNPIIVDDFIIIDRLEEYEDLIIINDFDGDISLEDLPKPININPLKIDKEKPYILLYHTHGTEAYSSIERNNIHHTTDRNYNVTTVGETMSKVLEAQGHNIKHITEYHDIPSYNKSYSRSLNTVTQQLQENSNFKILLDIHRDGFDLDDPKVEKNLKNLLEKSKTKINGKDVATFFFVIGPDSPNKEAVMSFAKYVKAVTDILYPELCTGIVIKPVGKYNQYLSDYSALIEIGSNLNTMDEAMETAKIVGEILSMIIEKIQEK